MTEDMCRTCLATHYGNQEMVQLNDVYKEKYNLHVILSEMMPTKIEYTDKMAKLLCTKCADKLIDFSEFINMCVNSHAKFYEQYQVHSEEYLEDSHKETKYECEDDYDWIEPVHEYNNLDDDEVMIKCEINPQTITFQSNLDEFDGKHSENVANCKSKVMNSDEDNMIKFACVRIDSNETILGTNNDELETKAHNVGSTRKAFRCPDCPDKTYETSSGLRKHRNKSHKRNNSDADRNNAMEQNSTATDDRKTKECHLCKKAFATVSGLRKHLIKTHHTKGSLNIYKCEFCADRFYSKNGFNKHMANAHESNGNNSLPEDDSIVRWKCGACGDAFKTRKAMHDHRLFTGHKTPRKPHARSQKRETGQEGDFHCDICKRTYTTKRKIRHHMEIHDPEKKKQKFLCTVCGIWLSSNHILESHYRAIHLGEKRFKCQYCDRLFSFRQDLKVHTNRHEGIRPYACKECPKTFFLSSNLKEHMESIHLNAKTHICTVCNKAFNRKGNLKLHTYTHTRQSPHQCSNCGAGFSRKYKLNEHVQNCERKEQNNTDQCNAVIEVPITNEIVLMNINTFKY